MMGRRFNQHMRFRNGIWFVRDVFVPSHGHFSGLEEFLVWRTDDPHAWDNKSDGATTTAATWTAYYDNGFFLT